MRREHHFVVYGTVDDKGGIAWTIDLDTTNARFPDGTVWDDGEQDWLGADDTPDIDRDDDILWRDLTKRLLH